MVQQYRGYEIENSPTSAPIRNFDWLWWHKDIAGMNDTRCGAAKSLAACKAAIDDQILLTAYQCQQENQACKRT